MIKRWLVWALAATVIIIITVAAFNERNPINTQYSLQVIQLDNGWGYEIITDNKVFILQKYIPVIPGNHLFENKNDAAKVGQLVLYKLQNNLSPTITLEDLNKLKLISN